MSSKLQHNLKIHNSVQRTQHTGHSIYYYVIYLRRPKAIPYLHCLIMTTDNLVRIGRRSESVTVKTTAVGYCPLHRLILVHCARTH
jgi:hypothetical protein